MQPIFPKWTNKIPTVVGIGVPLLLVLVISLIWYYFSPKYTDVGYQPKQPIPFSHKLHAGQLGLDCKYCHSTVDKASYAAIPSTATCMGCHNKVKTESPLLKPLRDSFEKNTPIAWVKIHSLPRHAKFDHSAHVNVGVGCVSCHGRIDKMEQVFQAEPLSMGWCLECHRNPGPNLRPLSEVTNLAYDSKKSGYDALKDPKRPQKLVQPPEACGACHY